MSSLPTVCNKEAKSWFMETEAFPEGTYSKPDFVQCSSLSQQTVSNAKRLKDT